MKLRLLCLFSLFFLLVSCGDEDRALTIESADIQANIDTDGTVHVTELYTYSDSFRKTTRYMHDNIANFKAYQAPDNSGKKAPETINLDPIDVKKIKNDYQIDLPSENKSNQLVFSYDIINAVTKYNDIADLQYTFFDSKRASEIRDITLTIRTPQNQIHQEAFIFFYSSNQPIIATNNDQTYYRFDGLSKSEAIDFKFIFPANALTNRPIDQAKNTKNDLLVEENALQSRYKNVEEKFNSQVSILLIVILVSLFIGAYLLLHHPNRSHKKNDKEAFVSLMEKTDPLIVHYVNNNAKLTKESIISGLFSLHKRDLITLLEVPSDLNQGNTFRFTWKRTHQKLVESDLYLKEWLFTQSDDEGPYFLLESLAFFEQNKSRSNKKNITKSDNFEKWCQLIEKNALLEKVRTNYIPYHLFCFLLVFVTLGIFTYFVFNNVWVRELQYAVILAFTFFGAIVLIYNCHKLFMIVLFSSIFLQSLFLTITTATILYLLFILLAASLSFFIPSVIWRSDMNELRRAINVAKKRFKQNSYPIGNTPKHVQQQMQYAIILNQENRFAQACKPVPSSLLVTGNYPLLHNSKNTAAVFDLTLQTINQNFTG